MSNAETYVLAIDQGTTGSTVMLIDAQMNVRAKENREFAQLFPKPGWVEHDPEAIWQSVVQSLRDVLAKAPEARNNIAGIGITNQRETTVLWDREATDRSRAHLHNAIVWQDRRTADRCASMRADGLESLYRQATGLVLDPYFSGTKLAWLLDHVDGAKARAAAGKLAFGTIESYLIWRLTGGKVHVTDVSNASRTLLFNINTMRWDEQLLAPLSIPLDVLPTTVSNSEIYGETQGVDGLPDGIPIAGAAGDQQAALFGQACFERGAAKCTYGTGAFLLLNTGNKVVASKNKLLSTVAWQLGEKTTYALEGSAFIAGAAVQWLRDGLGLIKAASDIEALAKQVDDSDGVAFVPALVGIGAPHWNPEARGTIVGITRGTTAAHLARATLDGIAFSITELVAAMTADAGADMNELRVDGGATQNELLLQIQCDQMGSPLVRPKVIETTALGAGLLAGLATGVWTDTADISAAWQPQARFTARTTPDERTALLAGWRKAIRQTLSA